MPTPVLTISQMREWEKATWATGQTEAEVIRLVGKHVAQRAIRLTKPNDQIVLLIGKGHNGEDARCAREHLVERRVDVLEVKDPGQDFSRLEALLSLKPNLLIDGLFGIGINRPLDSDWIRFLSRINDSHSPILSVDVPSGLNGDTGEPQGCALKATITLTVGAPKAGLLLQPAWPYVGRLEVAKEVGLVPCPFRTELNWTLPEDFAAFPPCRMAATHKGTYGHLAILAGSRGFHGAAVLAARGAQRAQPGLITLFTQDSVYVPVASQLQAVMVSPWSTNSDLQSHHTGILLGPGLAAPDLPNEIKTLTSQLWKESPHPMVVDASALAWLPEEFNQKKSGAIRVITPHPGEASRLLKTSTEWVQANRLAAVRQLSKKFNNAWIVLKGHQTLIGRSEGEVSVNSSGNPRLAQGGSGDTLSGYLAGLLAQPLVQSNPFEAIRFAVWQHGAAADTLNAAHPNWTIEDLVECIGSAPY